MAAPEANRTRPRDRRAHPERRREPAHARSTCSSRRRRRSAMLCWPCPVRGWPTSPRTTSRRTRSSRAPSSGEEELDELVVSIREIGVLQPIVVRPLPGAACRQPAVRAHHGRASPAGNQADRARHDPRGHQEHRGRGHAAGCPAGEPPPREPECPRGGVRLPAAARRLRHHAGAARRADRALPAADHQHPAPAAACRRACRSGSRQACSAPGHARAILAAGDAAAMERLADKIVNEDLSVRAAEAAAGRLLGQTASRGEAHRGQAPGSARRDRRATRRPARHPREGHPRREQGPDRDRLRHRRGPQPHPRRARARRASAGSTAARRALRRSPHPRERSTPSRGRGLPPRGPAAGSRSR